MANEIPGKKLIRSKDFKSAVVSNFGMRLNDNLCEITFGYETAIGGEEVVIEELKAVMTPRSLKILLFILQQSLPAFEAAIGGIKMPTGKEEEIQKTINETISKAPKPAPKT